MADKEIFFNAAIREAIDEEMGSDPSVILIGEDIGVYGGAFGVTKGLIDKYSPRRVIDAPISENSIVGLAVGAALTGLKPIVEIMYMDFILLAMDQIVNKAAKLQYIKGSGLELPIVIRTAGGAGKFYGPDHSQSFETLFAHIPGLTVIYPSNPFDAKAMLKAAVRLKRPVIFIENKSLYQSRGRASQDHGCVGAVGKAKVVSMGDKLTVVSYGRMIEICRQAIDGADIGKNTCELIDLVTLKPLDVDCISMSVSKTGRLLIVEESCPVCSIGSEISSAACEKMFDELKAPVVRLSAEDTPIPFSPYLEPDIFPKTDDIRAGIIKLIGR